MVPSVPHRVFNSAVLTAPGAFRDDRGLITTITIAITITTFTTIIIITTTTNNNNNNYH